MIKKNLKNLKRVEKSKKCCRRSVLDTLGKKSTVDLAIDDAMGFIKRLKSDPEFAKQWGY